MVRKIDSRLLIHMQNEGRVGGWGQIKAGFRKKLEGLVPGTPDYFLCLPTEKYHGLFLELKRPKVRELAQRAGEVSLAQKEFMDMVRASGYAAEVCYGWGQARDTIQEYMGWL